MEVWYLNSKIIDGEMIERLISNLPASHQQDVLRHHFLKDRAHKIAGRLMVEHLHSKLNVPFAWEKWKCTEGKKPFVQGGLQFNISHSGDYVAAIVSNKAKVGIDIEQTTKTDLLSILKSFHNEEQQFVREAEDQNEAFLHVWTRKEAFLKAKGVGIVHGLDNESCLPNRIESNGNWHIRSIKAIPKYHLAICSATQLDNTSIQEMDINELIERFKTAL